MKTFTTDRWAHAAGIPLAAAIVFTEDLVAMKLAELVARNRYRLTDRGVQALEALAAIPIAEKAA